MRVAPTRARVNLSCQLATHLLNVAPTRALLKNSMCTDLYESKIWPASQYGQAKSAIAPAAVVNRCPIARFPGDGAFPLLLRHHRAESRRFFAAGHSVDN